MPGLSTPVPSMARALRMLAGSRSMCRTSVPVIGVRAACTIAAPTVVGSAQAPTSLTPWTIMRLGAEAPKTSGIVVGPPPSKDT